MPGRELEGLKKARLSRGLSQTKLGKIAECGQPVVSSIETGRVVAYPKFRRLCSQFLGVPESELFPEVIAK